MSALQNAVADLDRKGVLMEIRRMIGRGEDPKKVLAEIRQGLHIIGERFEAKEYALMELEMATELFKESVKIVENLTDKTYPGSTAETTGKNPRHHRKTNMEKSNH